MNFSTNQVMQFYVNDSAKGCVASTEIAKRHDGGFKLVFTTDGSVADAKGSNVVVTTDVIQNVLWGKLTQAGKLAIPLTAAKITLDKTVNGGAPIKGEDYIVRVSYPEVGGLGNEGWTTKTVSARATSAGALYGALAVELAKAFANDGVLAVYTTAGILLTGEEKVYDVATKGIIITQADPTATYEVGVAPVVIAPFTVSAPTIVVEGEAVQPFDETSFEVVESVNKEGEADVIANGYKVADMEYFALGERGDQYRNAGWPDVIRKSKDYYKVDPAGEYDVLNVHYAFVGDNANAHRCEKDLIIVAPKAQRAKLAAIATAIETACGKTFTKVNEKVNE